jgi:hypothetical protein
MQRILRNGQVVANSASETFETKRRNYDSSRIRLSLVSGPEHRNRRLSRS